MNNDIQKLLDYADKLEWQPIETMPYPQVVLVKNIANAIVLCRKDELNTMQGIVGATHWMPLPDGNAGAVIRELVEALEMALIENEKYGCDLGAKIKHDIKQALAKAAALVGGQGNE